MLRRHKLPCDHPQRNTYKVFLEDTDAMGRVYHASYLKFLSRARSEMIGLERMHDWTSRGIYLVVYDLHIRYHAPARFGDELTVSTCANLRSSYRLIFDQEIHHHDERIISAEVHVTCVNQEGALQNMKKLAELESILSDDPAEGHNPP